MKTGSHPYLAQLTYLRGIAALFVMFCHINRANETSYSGEIIQQFWLLKWLDMGDFGVMLFFSLSGCTLYLSTSHYCFKDLKRWYAFFLNRFFRIWPAFALSMLAYMVASHLFKETFGPFKESWIAPQFINPYSTADIFNYLLLIFNATGPAGLFNNAFWSLPIEFQYYLTLPILVLLTQRFGIIAIITAITASQITYKSNFFHFENLLVFRLFFTFCLGVYAGYLFERTTYRLPAWFALLSFALLTSFVYFFSLGYFTKTITISDLLVYGFVASITVIVVTLTKFNLPNVLTTILIFYGTISYSLYLLHNLVIAVVVVIFIEYSAWLAPYKLLFISLTTCFVTTFIAWISYRYIELPSIQTGKYLSRQ